ncbi:MAG: VanW family protein [Patescibacteria group bacterium]
MSESKRDTKNFLGSPKRVVLAGVLCLIFVSGLIAVQVVRADGRILPNVAVGGVEVGGLTPPEARDRLEEAMRAVNVGGVQFRYQDRSLTVRANDKSSAPPSQSPITYDLDGMVREAFAFGHDEGSAELLKANIRAFFGEVSSPVIMTVDKRALRDLMNLRFGALEKPAKDASIVIARRESRAATDDASGTPAISVDWDIEVLPDAAGAAFDYDAAIEAATSRLSRWQGATVDVAVKVKEPDVTFADAEAAKPRVVKALERGDVLLAYDDLTWTLKQKTLENALELRPRQDGSIGVVVKREVLGPLLDVAASDIESDAKPTSFTVVDDRATDFVGGSMGKRIDRENTLASVDERFESSENGVFPIVVMTTPSPKSAPVAEELGVRELLGYGTSSFAGSPNNRRKNIANGARLLNGLIIKPGEEFGLLEHLKPFDAKNGYFPELVIKEKRTVPEFGGGLCQIGTTTFRATMGAGLPITQRQNHSYRVVYYEPVGTDATIYDPAPDYRLLNDTGSHVVLITKQIKDTLRFEFWGTRDGRVQSQSKIRQWNAIAPPEPKLIETSALSDGVKKCFETAHGGISTSFTYTITYPDGTVKDKEFRSVYKPWQAQCLVGKTGAPHISMGKDGSLNEKPVTASASATPAVQLPGFN